MANMVAIQPRLSVGLYSTETDVEQTFPEPMVCTVILGMSQIYMKVDSGRIHLYVCLAQ